MLFTSYSFMFFLVLLFAVYYTIPKKYQWMLLLVASYTFYALASVKFLLYIFITTISTYVAAKEVGKITLKQSSYLDENKEAMSKEERKAYNESMKRLKRKWLISCMLINFGLLAIIKYTNFAISNVNYIAQAMGSDLQFSFWNLALPMGISFYIFQSMSYMIDVYRGKYMPQENFFKLALFVSFFPQLVQGPISRYDDLSKTLYSQHTFDFTNVSFGVQRILWGLFKKLVIADRLVIAVNEIVKNPDHYTGAFVLVGMLFYAFELYCDFTGGIDITIGVAQVLGIKVQENFQRPFFSKNIAEFWRRWHITMGTWFKDYMFYPISVSKRMLKISKASRRIFGDAIGKRVPVYLATLIVWFTTGLWHGATWNFIVWGTMNGVVIILSLELKPFYEWFHKRFQVKNALWFRSFQVIRTVLLMSALRMFDTYRDVPLTFKMFWSMITNYNYDELFSGALMNLGLALSDYGIIACGFVIVLGTSLVQRKGPVREQIMNKPILVRSVVYYVLILSILVFGAYGMDYDSNQFIYNQF
jgi:alginate O-acetyltransferase complex protein AlgI